MAQKHLHELLKEDQEPFLLKNYIADRRCQLKRPPPKTQLQVKRRKPITHGPNFAGNFCKNACFFSYQESPDLRKSPLFEFHSPAKSPCRSPNAIFLHIPAKTAALLLEAAMKIQKQSSSKKSKSRAKTQGFGLFGSFLKRLNARNRNQKREVEADEVKVSVRDILRWDSFVGRRKGSGEGEDMHGRQTVVLEERSGSARSAPEMGFTLSCNGRPSSSFWSESNEEISLDLETSCSSVSNSGDTEEIRFVSQVRNKTVFACCENAFCESPFRFVLQQSPSSGRQTPEFSSPTSSPGRQRKEDQTNHEAECLKKLQVEEDKEQCSPVSVLDPPFEDDDDAREPDDEADGYDLECSYAIVQKTKQQLLQKLRRFEKLAELDPVELEKRMVQEEDDDLEKDESEDSELVFLDTTDNAEWCVREVINNSSLSNSQRLPKDMKRLVADLIAEERRVQSCFGITTEEVVVKRACKKLESWKEVEPNTIDMMVEQDFKRELYRWNRMDEDTGETAIDIEIGIFGLLLEELLMELLCSAAN